MEDKERMGELAVRQVRKETVDPKQIIHSLRDRAIRSPDQSAGRIMLKAVAVIQSLEEDVILLRSKLEKIEEAQRWISVKERKSTGCGEYLVMISGADRPTALWYNPEVDVWFADDFRDRYPVEKWMELPKGPEE